MWGDNVRRCRRLLGTVGKRSEDLCPRPMTIRAHTGRRVLRYDVQSVTEHSLRHTSTEHKIPKIEIIPHFPQPNSHATNTNTLPVPLKILFSDVTSASALAVVATLCASPSCSKCLTRRASALALLSWTARKRAAASWVTFRLAANRS